MTQTSAYMARTDQFIQKTDAFMDRIEMRMQNQEAALKSLENQVGKISQVLKSRPMRGFPSDTEVAKGATHEQCKAISTRSGKVLKPPTENNQGEATVAKSKAASNIDSPAPADTPASAGEDHNIPEEAGITKTTSQPEQPKEATLEEPRPPPPFPQRLKKQKHEYQYKKFFDILKQVHINLPLVEALQQMPNYAKFLKDMVSRKTRIGEFETAAATEACLAMMHNKVPAKKTDPGSFTIPCSIGKIYSTKALCDPGASINLMPKSVFQKLGIGEAKPTTVMLQLADRLYVQPEGKIEDILVRVDKFIFPADFLILDCEADEHAPIILGRPFLATSRVLMPLVEALQQMPNYAKFLKDMVSRKTRIGEFETAAATEACLAMMHNKVPAKKTDPGSFTIPCSIGKIYSTKALCDPGASINLMPKSVFQKLGIGEAKPTTVMLQLADRLYVQPEGKIEDILVRVDKFIFPADFLILDCEADEHAPIILGRPFLATSRVLIDFEKGELVLRVDEEQVKINVFSVPGQQDAVAECKALSTSTKRSTKIKP
ncbi:hypothetical protein V6N13_109450 [Hibiscus sabdariffa]